MSDADQFLIKAKQAVLAANDAGENLPIWGRNDIYIVWFCKALGNWKALVSTDAVDGYYWEVTYNGAKGETYVDTYTKAANVCIPDAD